MAKKAGICMNLDCENYKKEVEIEPGGEFECPLCHQPLREGRTSRNNGNTDGPNKKKVMMIAGGLVVVAAATVGGLIFMNDGKGEVPPTIPQEVNLVVDSVKVDTTNVIETLQTAEEVKESPKKQEQNTSQPQNGKGTVNLGYGTYKGELKDGKPHGYGTITYTTSHQIVSSKDFIANPGDTFEGEFRDGRISGLGYWKHNGDETAVKP